MRQGLDVVWIKQNYNTVTHQTIRMQGKSFNS